MGILDRFRSAGQTADAGNNKADTHEQDALRLIDAGHAHEANGRIDEAMQCYLDAIRLAPSLARAHLNHGNILLAKGDLKGALAAFRTAIEHKPDYAGAYYNMGNALLGNGQTDEAVSSYHKALEIKPDYAEVHCSLGVALKELGRLDDAVTSYRRALEIKPDCVEAYTNLGIILEHLYNTGIALLNDGKLDAAVENFHCLLKIEPNLADAHYHLGNALQKLGQNERAVASYRRVLELKPDYAEAHSNLGVVLHDLGQYEEAVASYRRALEIKPDYAEAHSNLGATLKEQGKLAEAAASYGRALEIKPGFADAYSNLGVVLYDLGQHKEAMVKYRRALEINPDLAVAHSNLGSALKEQGKFTEADASYKRALEIEPDNAIFRVAQMFNLPIAPQSVEASVAVPDNFDRSLKNLSDWMLAAPEQRKQLIEALSLQPTFYLAYRGGNHIARLSRFGDMVAASSQQAPFKPVPEREKLRLVVVSNYFRRHSVWDVILRGILVNLDRTRFEVVLYNTGNTEDGETNLAKSLSDGWRDSRTVAGLNGWLEAMAADQPDVIFYPEIGMDQMTLNLATHRLAPLQVASWGHPITTGLPTIDIYFSGEMLEPPDADTHYRERLVRLPGTGCCTTPIELKPEELHQLSADLAMRRGPRFVIAQTPYKFDPADDALFASIAAAVGECTFILVSDPQFQWAMERLIERLNRAFIERNLDPKQHLLVVSWVPREKFYTLLDLSDIFLDCPSFSGYTTAWQAVQRGLPVLTLEGKFMRQRLAAGLLRKIGMTDTIAASVDEYVAIAKRLAAECRDPDRRDARRRALKAAAPLADNDVSVVRAFERNLIEALAERGRHFEFEVAKQSTSINSHPSKGLI
ncbi:MAG: tetratricopeptide repeat protein [Gallionella sp.]|nr:tetratricopeptide repeat protein [Gallionella sp.]